MPVSGEMDGRRQPNPTMLCLPWHPQRPDLGIKRKPGRTTNWCKGRRLIILRYFFTWTNWEIWIGQSYTFELTQFNTEQKVTYTILKSFFSSCPMEICFGNIRTQSEVTIITHQKFKVNRSNDYSIAKFELLHQNIFFCFNILDVTSMKREVFLQNCFPLHCFH